MDPSKRNAASLHQRVDDACDNIMSRFSTVLAVSSREADNDYAASAHNELTIAEESASLVQSTQDISTLIRDLQELWLFGGLDTLADPADEQANKLKALDIAALIETLAQLDKPDNALNEISHHTHPEDGKK